MSVENFIRAMPKVDLHVQLEGAISKDFIMLVAEQTDVARNYKREKDYRAIRNALQKPNFDKLDEIARETSTWVRHPEDIARVIYDLGVNYFKQNVKYAEISIIPAQYTDLDMTFQVFLEAVNDGADRVFRAWGVRISWILAIPRERPRKSDDIARWATSVTAQKGGVVALSLVGRENAQPVAQFKKAFATAEKKGVARVTHLYSYPKSDPFTTVFEATQANRVTDSWGLLDDEEAVAYLIEHDIPVLVTPSRELKLGRIKKLADYPMRAMLDAGLTVLVGSGMPAMFETSLTDEYLALVEVCGITLEEIQQMVLNSLYASFLVDEERQTMLAEFKQAFAALREEHLAETE
jgi:aminodeoxyfutalosine deaminase